jgi:hypothetical protein
VNEKIKKFYNIGIFSTSNQKWYLPTGISNSNCVAAYQAKGVLSYTVSKVNLVNPGTYNLIDAGHIPDWDTVNGWGGGNTGKYLNTGISPVTQTWSMFVKTTGGGTSYGTIAGVWNNANNRVFMYHGYTDKVWIANDGITEQDYSPSFTSGVYGFSGSIAYRNGVAETPALPSGVSGAVGTNLYLLVLNYDSNGSNPVAYYPFYGNIQAVAIYNMTLTLAQVTQLTSSMNAL